MFNGNWVKRRQSVVRASLRSRSRARPTLYWVLCLLLDRSRRNVHGVKLRYNVDIYNEFIFRLDLITAIVIKLIGVFELSGVIRVL